ncbi:caffeine-induced death protein cid2 [Physcia stellaris]|nr:caffeine-induced death protein cid2 [Physcia stellaris]
MWGIELWFEDSKPVSRPKAHTGRTTSTRKPKPAIAPETATTKAPRKTTATKKKPVAKKTGLGKPKSKAKTKTKRKTKTKAKAKPKPKKKVKKVLSEKQVATVAAKKKRSDLKALKEIALTPPKLKPFTAYQVVFAEDNQKRTAPVSRNAGLATGDGYKSLSPERREHYNHIANQNKAANAIQYRQWIESHTPEVIRKANNARKLLRRREKGRWTLLQDDRSVKSFKTGYIYFCSDRRASGDFAGISLVDSAKRMGQEWKELSAEEKKPYMDRQQQDMSRYAQEKKTVYDRNVVASKPQS